MTSSHVENRCFDLGIRRRICLSTPYSRKPGLPTPGSSFIPRPPIAYLTMVQEY